MTVDVEARRPPTADQFEVSLFGPGVGECIVVHTGHGEWIVVDSCMDTDSGQPVALHYLNSLGVDIALAVRLIVVSHWHDDHVQGISQLFVAARSAKLACSAALRTNEFWQMISVARNRSTIRDRTGIDEMSALFQELKRRLPPGARAGGETPDWAVASRMLYQRFHDASISSCRVISLSPSDRAIKLAQLQLAGELAAFREGKAGRRLVSQTPNEVAVALWVEAGAARILLGADLEESRDPGNGWQAIVAQPRPPGEGASTLKVPHHGSPNADSPAVWAQMLTSLPYALLTPFRRQKLPTDIDLRRIRGRTSEVYCTATPRGRKPARRAPAVERTLREITREREIRIGRAGHVRLRGQLTTGVPEEVALFNGAFKVG
jgi:beta-lactamase superfamily II metal-dependent hydrolase